MPRGGRRSGKPGGNYPNRTDMALAPRALPVTTAPGQEYGAAGEQAQAQQAVPMASGPLTQAPDIQQAAQQYTPPPVVPIGAASQNPNEHVITGMDAGIGQTMPTQAAFAQSPVLKGVALLNTLGDSVSPETRAIRDALTAAQGNEQAP